MPRAVVFAILTKELKSLKWPVFNFSALHTNLYFANSIVSEPNGINTNILFGNSKIMLLFVCTTTSRRRTCTYLLRLYRQLVRARCKTLCKTAWNVCFFWTAPNWDFNTRIAQRSYSVFELVLKRRGLFLHWAIEIETRGNIARCIVSLIQRDSDNNQINHNLWSATVVVNRQFAVGNFVFKQEW